MCSCASSAATRKQEVAGIRSKFPNKIPVSERPRRGAGTGCSDPVLSPAGHHRALRQREISASAGQNQVPGAARAHHDAVRHHHQVNSPGGDLGVQESNPSAWEVLLEETWSPGTRLLLLDPAKVCLRAVSDFSLTGSLNVTFLGNMYF